MKKNFQDMFFNDADELSNNYISNDPYKGNQFDERNFYSNATNNTQFLNTKKTFTDKVEKYSSDGLNYTSSQQMKLQDIYTEEQPQEVEDEEEEQEVDQQTNYLVYDQHIHQQKPEQQSAQNRSQSQKQYDSKINSSYQSNNQINSSLSSSYTNYHQKKLKEKYSHFFEHDEENSNQQNLSPKDLQASEGASNRNKRFASCDAYSYQHKKSEQDQQNQVVQQIQQQHQEQIADNNKSFNNKNISQQQIIQQNQNELNYLKDQFLQKVEEIQNNLKSIDPYKISLNSIHSNTTSNFNQTYIKRQEELNSNLLKINQLFERQNFLDSTGSQEMRNQLNNININNIDQNKLQKPNRNMQNKKPPFVHPAGESSIIKNKINQNDFFEDSLHNNTGQRGVQNQQLNESENIKQKQDLKDRSLLDILKKKEHLYEKYKRDYNQQKEELQNQNKNILQGNSYKKDPYKAYSRDSLDRQKIQFYDSFMPSNMRMMKSPYQLLKYKMNNKAKFDIQSCISELASLNSSLRSTNYK